MKDRDFLIWIHDRLTFVHKEDELKDYMWKLRSIIESMDKEVETPNTTNKGIEDLRDDRTN